MSNTGPKPLEHELDELLAMADRIADSPPRFLDTGEMTPLQWMEAPGFDEVLQACLRAGHRHDVPATMACVANGLNADLFATIALRRRHQEAQA